LLTDRLVEPTAGVNDMAEAILPDNTVDDFRSWIGDIQLRR